MFIIYTSLQLFFFKLRTSNEEMDFMINETKLSLSDDLWYETTFPFRKISRYIICILKKDENRSYFILAEVEVRMDFEDGEEHTPDYPDYCNFEIEEDLGIIRHLIKGKRRIFYDFEGVKFGLFVLQKEAYKIIATANEDKKENTEEPSKTRNLIFNTNELEKEPHNLVIEVLEGGLEVDACIKR